MKIKQINWGHDTPNQRAPGYVIFFASKAFRLFQRNYKSKIRNVFYSIKNANSTRACYQKEDIDDFGKSFISLCEDKNFLIKVAKNIKEIGRKLVNSAKRLDNIQRLTKKEIIKCYIEICKYYRELFEWAMIPELSVDYIEEDFKKELKSEFGKNYEKYSTVLSTTDKKSYLKEEEENLLKIKEEWKKRREISKLIENHQKKYFWIKNNYADTYYLGKYYFIKRLKELKEKENDLLLKEKEKILKEIKNKKLKIIIEIINYLPYFQDLRKKSFMITAYYLNIFYEWLNKKYKINKKDLLVLLPDDIISLLKGSKIEYIKNKIKKRRKLFTVYLTDNKIRVYEGDKAERIEEKIAPKRIDFSKTVLKGNIASKGKVIGKVKVIKSIKEINKIKKGDILVTSNTTPDYVPFMKRSAAIITEKGGVSSHAAIVSREIGVPCIVGIKYITMILKDDDLVEVDANKGIVKILKRK